MSESTSISLECMHYILQNINYLINGKYTNSICSITFNFIIFIIEIKSFRKLNFFAQTNMSTKIHCFFIVLTFALLFFSQITGAFIWHFSTRLLFLSRNIFQHRCSCVSRDVWEISLDFTRENNCWNKLVLPNITKLLQ